LSKGIGGYRFCKTCNNYTAYDTFVNSKFRYRNIVHCVGQKEKEPPGGGSHGKKENEKVRKNEKRGNVGRGMMEDYLAIFGEIECGPWYDEGFSF
jgi:hypothetical protein